MCCVKRKKRYGIPPELFPPLILPTSLRARLLIILCFILNTKYENRKNNFITRFTIQQFRCMFLGESRRQKDSRFFDELRSERAIILCHFVFEIVWKCSDFDTKSQLRKFAEHDVVVNKECLYRRNSTLFISCGCSRSCCFPGFFFSFKNGIKCILTIADTTNYRPVGAVGPSIFIFLTTESVSDSSKYLRVTRQSVPSQVTSGDIKINYPVCTYVCTQYVWVYMYTQMYVYNLYSVSQKCLL